MATPESILLKLFQIFSKSFRLNIFGKGLYGLEFIDKEVFRLMAACKSRLTNAFLDFEKLSDFCQTINQKSHGVEFNHLGFCYSVKSKNEEKVRLLGVAANNKINLYELPSSDLSLWLFMGDKSIPKDPMIEFLPVEKTNDYYADYWLPSFHFALNTKLSAEAIKYLTHDVFEGERRATPSVEYGRAIFQSRFWLGVIDGINFCLDFLTNVPGNSLSETRKFLRRI